MSESNTTSSAAEEAFSEGKSGVIQRALHSALEKDEQTCRAEFGRLADRYGEGDVRAAVREIQSAAVRDRVLATIGG